MSRSRGGRSGIRVLSIFGLNHVLLLDAMRSILDAYTSFPLLARLIKSPFLLRFKHFLPPSRYSRPTSRPPARVYRNSALFTFMEYAAYIQHGVDACNDSALPTGLEVSQELGKLLNSFAEELGFPSFVPDAPDEPMAEICSMAPNPFVETKRMVNRASSPAANFDLRDGGGITLASAHGLEPNNDLGVYVVFVFVLRRLRLLCPRALLTVMACLAVIRYRRFTRTTYSTSSRRSTTLGRAGSCPLSCPAGRWACARRA